MSNSDKNICDQLKCNFKIWISTSEEDSIMSNGKWQILKAIDKHGSLRAATNELGIKYRKTWNDLKKVEDYFGFSLIEKARGGKNGGTTTLTKEGRNLVKAFDKFYNKIDSHIDEAFAEFKKEMV